MIKFGISETGKKKQIDKKSKKQKPIKNLTDKKTPDHPALALAALFFNFNVDFPHLPPNPPPGKVLKVEIISIPNISWVYLE